MPISKLWSVLVSSRGTDGRTNDDQGKDLVPSKILFSASNVAETDARRFS